MALRRLYLIMLLSLLLLTWDQFISGKTSETSLPSATFQMVDEIKPGQTVGNICHALWPKSSIVFSLIVVTSSRFQRFNEYFSITKNGSIVAQKFVDRDNVNDICGPLDCCQSAICIIHARVMFIVEQSENSMMHSHDQVLAHLQIHLADINDNSPQFPLNSQGYPHFTIRVQEGAKFAREMLPSAVDLDSAGNGVVQYRIKANSPSADLFQLTYEKVLINPLSESHGWRLSPPTLIQLRELDYENPADKEFELIVIAIDGGEPSLTGSLSVTVVLMDINDNTPVFDRTNISNIELAENTTYSPDPVYRFLATDMDSVDNGLITYSLSPLNEPKVFEKFSIDGRSGALYLNSILDYEVYSERRFTVIVVASDNGTPKRSGTTTLTVVTKDVNDNLPSLVVQENITVIEGLNYTKPVVRFYVKDDDSVSRGKVICRPAPNRVKGAGSASLRLQEVTTNAYFVFTEGIFDYEEAQSASVEIVCSDSADPFDTRERILRITLAIGDANDHYPEFGVTELLAKLPEHSPKGKRVTQVTANDADAGIHARLTYSLINSSGRRCSVQEIFSIDSMTGVVTVKDSECLDREVNEEIEAFAAAEDGGGLSTSVKLRIRLTDINDNSPSIQVLDSLSVAENLPAGVVVGRVRCTDADIGPNSEIRLELAANNTQQVRNAFDTIRERGSARNLFLSHGMVRGMNDITGLLVTKKPLDREDIESYTIHFVATDSGNPQRTTYKSVQVLVLDENDNVPALRFPHPDTTVGYHPQVYTNSPHGSKVCVLRSYDPDKGENGTVIYTLQQNTNGSRYFQLDQATGELTTAWHHRGPTPGVYAVRVLLYDMGQNPTKAAWNFFVYISPRNTLLDTVHLSRSFSTGTASNVTASSKSKSRLTHTTVIMISVAVLIFLVIIVSCICMIKVLLRSRAKNSHQNHNHREDDGVMKEPSAAIYSPPALNMVFTQAAPLVDNTMTADNQKYTVPTPGHSGWCMKPFGQNEVVTQVTPDVHPVDGSAGSNYLFASLQTGCNTFSRGGYSSLWQNYPIS